MKIQKIKPELKSLIKNFDSGNIYLDQFLKSEDAFNDSLGKILWDDTNVPKAVQPA